MSRSFAPFLAVLLASAPAAQLLPEVSEPPGNATTPEKVALGQALFWEQQLSSNDTVACGTCHRFEHGGSDPRIDLSHPGFDGIFGTEDDIIGSPGVASHGADGSLVPHAVFGHGVQVTRRRPRSPINAAFFGELFWDGRARDTFLDPETGEVALEHSAALESQAVQPILNAEEMSFPGRDWSQVLEKLESATPLALAAEVPEALVEWIGGRGYPALFAEAFGDETLSARRVAMAIAAYERTLISDQAPVLLDDDESGFEWTELEEEGRFLFENLACATCHPTGNGLFTDMAYHILGVRPRDEDWGLEERSDFREDRGRFLTPSLLNVSLRAPYFHDGSKATLEDVVEFYDRGGDHGPREIGPIGLSEPQKAALVAYLRRPLTDPRLVRGEGPFERPRLADDAALFAVEASSERSPEAERETRVLVVRGDATVSADFGGEVAIESGLASIDTTKSSGALERVALEGGDLELIGTLGERGRNGRSPLHSLSIGRLLVLEDAQLTLDRAKLLGTLAILSDVTLTVDVDRGWVPGDWAGSGTLRLRAPNDEARIQRGPALSESSFRGTLELARGILVPGGRESLQPLSAGRLILGSLEGRGWLVRPFDAVDFLPDEMPIEVYDGGLSLGFQQDERVGPLSLFGSFEVRLSIPPDRFTPPSNPAEHVFADCTAEPWSTSANLRFVGWYDGENESEQGVDRLVFEGLRDEQLARIVFVDPVGYAPGEYKAKRLADGEVVPVLE